MKKLMIFLVCLIPFVLIFTIQFSSVYVEKTKYVSVEKVLFSQDNMNIEKTSSDAVVLDFQASVYPLAATNKKIEYTSSDPTIATVDENGKITFINFGSVIITAVSSESDLIKDSCTFFVTDNKVHKIEITEKPEVLKLSESAVIKHKIIPNEASDKTVTYTSSNTSVLTVTPTGKVTAVGKGVATITLESVNNVVESFTVEVIVPVTNVEIDSQTKHFITGNFCFLLNQINYQVLPSNANNQNVTFESQNSEVAQVVDDKIIFASSGEVSFKIHTEDGDKTDSFSVYYTGGYFLSASIKERFKNISVEFENQSEIILEYDLYPIDADYNNISFTSSNEDVVTVDNTGKISICGGGNAVVTMIVQSTDEPITNSINVSVSRKATEIVAENKNISEPTYQLEYQVLPQDNTSSLTFSVNSDIATITQSGFLSFKKQGAVIVTISTSCGQTKTVVVEWIKADASNIRILENNQKITLNYLDSFNLVFDSALEMGIAEYSLLDSSIIEIDDETEEFTAIKGGTTSIVATYLDKQITIIVEVIRRAEEIVLSSSDITISNNIVTAKKQIQLVGEVLPADTTNKTIVWSTSNSDIAYVTNGLVQFTSKGTVTIVAVVDSINTSVTIRSTFGNPDSFKLEIYSYTIPDINETFNIKVLDEFSPSDVVKNDLEIGYKSLNTKVATVSNSGVVTAVAVCSTKIVVTIGEATKEVDITVQAKTKSVAILFDGNEISSGKIVGLSIQLSCIVTPDYATTKDVSWSVVSGNDIATVSESGIVNFNGFGSATIRVTTKDTGVTDDVIITRISEISNIKLFDKDDNLISSSAEQSVNGTIPTMIKTPDETENIIVRVELVADGLLDPENVNIEDVVASVLSVDDGLNVTITRNEQNKNYYSIARSSINKKSVATIKFDYISGSVQFKIEYRHLKSLSLALKNEDDVNYGLEGKRVFATRTYDSTSSTGYTSLFSIEYSRYPEDNQDELYWQVEGVGATISNGVLTIDPNAITQETQITVTVWADGVTPVKYTYTFVAGKFINVSDPYGLDWASGNSYGAVLHASLGSDEDNIGGAYSPFTYFNYNYDKDKNNYTFWNMIYGNGYTINTNAIKGAIVTYYGLRNITIKGENFNSDKDYSTTISLGRDVVYSRIQQMKKSWTGPASGTSITMKNSIFKHSAQCGLQIGTDAKGSIYLENTIFADVAQAAVDYQSGDLYIKGIFDVYNFRTPSAFSIGKTTITKAFKESSFEKYVYKPEGKENKKYADDYWQANIAIAMLPPSLTNLKVSVSDVYFWNGTEYTYLGDGTETETGLGYNKLYYKYLGITVYLITPPIESSYIKYDSELTTEGESKVYSPAKIEALKKENS